MSNIDRAVFSDEQKSNKLAPEPECMKIKNMPPLNPRAPKMSEEEEKNAYSTLISKSYTKLNFPKILRTRVDPPIPNQQFFIMSFTPSPNATPDSDGCFGSAKIRGSFATVDEAEEYSQNLIKNVDSYNTYDIAYVGKDFPVTGDTERYCTNTNEVDIRMNLDSTSKANILQQKANDKKEIQEINSRHKELLDDTKKEKESIDIEYYTTLKQKKASMRIMMEECQKKQEEAKKILEKTFKELEDLDQKHPEFKDQYTEIYKKATINIGADKASSDKMISYMK
jgi:hypothetical protein